MLDKIKDFKTQLIVVCVLSFVLNVNTLKNQYALDDEIIIHQNLNVQAGFSGIGAILKTDAFQGYLDMAGAQSPVSGGRFRPLSIVTFAVEQALFGETYGLQYREAQQKLSTLENTGASQNEILTQLKELQSIKENIEKTTLELAPLRHIIQLVLFILSMLVLLLFLRKHIFPENALLALLTTLLFVAHPVHTEVIANIKSRDEIISLLFIVLTLHFSFNYIKEKTSRNLWLLTLSFILALLSKEYAMILPAIVVVGWFTIFKISYKEMYNKAFYRLVGIALGFIFIRFTLFSNVNTTNSITDVLNDPYLYASFSEKTASKVAILLEYLRVLFFPIQLSSDYSYAHFAYIGFGNWKFLTALIAYIGLLFGFFYAFKKRWAIAFPLAIFVGFLFLINNLFFNIGATMGERLVYHSSLGLCLLLVVLGNFLYAKINGNKALKNSVVVMVTLSILLLFSYKTIQRNAEWQSDYTLFNADVKTVPNSAMVNNNVASQIYNQAYRVFSQLKNPTQNQTLTFKKELQKALPYFNKTLSVHNRYVVAYMNRGLCYFRLGNRQKAAEDWIAAAENFKGPHPFLKQNALTFYDEGVKLGAEKQFEKAVLPLQIASKINPYDAIIWNNLGGAYFMTGKFDLAVTAFTNALNINSTLKDAEGGKNVAASIFKLEEAVVQNPMDAMAKSELQKAYLGCGLPKEFQKIKL
jgi:protein O-mannosyl-transferase